MALTAGTRLGPYEIRDQIGAGGMGEVYRATDTRLDRTVAIKVLPEHLADDPQRRERFEREARAVSSLNHPHICALHDIGEQDGIHYLVMELVEGETLQQRLEKGRLSLDQALEYAIQIADALDKAHRQGVVHRDLKPGNIMLTKSGTKLLDFGLAKLKGDAGGVSPLSQMPTQDLSQPLTAEGTIIGTLQYMAPEQLEGQEADARTDIFAFGAVVYEMVAGRKAFEGRSQVSLMAAILEHTPVEMSSLQAMTPPALDRIVKVCLEKDPEERWQTARDVARELKWASAPVTEKPTAPLVAPVTQTSGRSGWAVAAIAASAALALAVLYFRGPAPEVSTMRFHIPTATTAQPADLNVSPDGRHVAFIAQGAASAEAVWVRTLDQFEARELPGTEGANEPFWSPDSRFVGFFADGKLKKIDIAGGPPQNLSDVLTAFPAGGTWSKEGTILFSSNHQGTYIIHSVADAGGLPEPVTRLDVERNEAAHGYPKFLPAGRHFLLNVGIGVADNIHIGSLDSQDTVPLMENASMAGYTDAGYVLFVRDQVLMAQPFDAGRLEVGGQPFPVADQVLYFPNSAHGAYSVSGGGVLAYRGGVSEPPEPVWFDRSGRRLGKVEEAGGYNQFWLSPDEERMAALSEGDIWVVDMLRGSRSRLTFDPALDRYPLWSPEGDRIVFSSQRIGAGEDLFLKSAMGTGDAQILLETDEDKFPTDWSSDGRYVLYTNRSAETARDVWALPLDGDQDPFPVLNTPFREWHAMFSPDGRWIAYDSNETGRDEVYVQPFPPTGGKWQVSVEGGHMARWREDGRELFFVGASLTLMAVEVSGGEQFSHGVPEALFRPNVPGVNQRYRVTENGQRFLMRSLPPAATIPPINVVVNWTAELQQ